MNSRYFGSSARARPPATARTRRAAARSLAAARSRLLRHDRHERPRLRPLRPSSRRASPKPARSPRSRPATKSSVTRCAISLRVLQLRRRCSGRRELAQLARASHRVASPYSRPVPHDGALACEILGRPNHVRIERARQPLVRGHQDDAGRRARFPRLHERMIDDVRPRSSGRCSIAAIASAYGRACFCAASARRIFAAATCFIAFVICCVFFSDRIRSRRSLTLGTSQLPTRRGY